MRLLLLLVAGAFLFGCARSEPVRTSANTMIIQTSAAPVCGGAGAVRVAQQMAAVETIKAGFDRYIITAGQAQNNVAVTQMPGSYNTTLVGGRGFYQGTTTYQPGPTIVHGSHDQGLAVANWAPPSIFRPPEVLTEVKVGIFSPNSKFATAWAGNLARKFIR